MDHSQFTKSGHLNQKRPDNIVIEYSDLKQGKDLITEIEKAYGPQGYGILFVNGIPGYSKARQALLQSIWQLGNLPAQTLKKYERPEIYHSLGWSKGAEQYEGQYDDAKGSYYMNCCTDEPLKISEQNRKYYTPEEISMIAGNVWIKELPHIESNVKALSKLMIETGALLARQIDSTISKKVKTYQENHLTKIITEGQAHIGRMLHYFPFNKKDTSIEADWCGWHNDHGALTALTSAMYMDENGKQVKIQKSDGGLYAKNRFAEMVRIVIPPEMLAFQLGQVSQIISGGYLQATPHCVVKSSEIAGKRISRETFALFMQPNGLERLSVPDGVEPTEITMKEAYNIPQIGKRWSNDMIFKEFHQATIKNYS